MNAGPPLVSTPRLRLPVAYATHTILILCVGLYARIGAPWWLFAAAFLAPDLSFAGYLFGGRIGAWASDQSRPLPDRAALEAAVARSSPTAPALAPAAAAATLPICSWVRAWARAVMPLSSRG